MPKMNSWGFERQVEVRCKAGRSLPLAQIRIVDGEMNDLPHDGKTSGELVARAPWLTQGYLKDLKSSEKLWEGGWLHTGDLATIDAEEGKKNQVFPLDDRGPARRFLDDQRSSDRNGVPLRACLSAQRASNICSAVSAESSPGSS